MELVISLLKIGKMRFEDRITWTVNCSEDLRDVRVPPFLVQPLVENALRHGVENSEAPVHIDVEARQQDGRLSISVTDNGAGRHAIPSGNRSGVGLDNLKKRLQLMSNDETEFRVSVPPGGGFRVEVKLPIETGHA
jgi:sensor histidine kinase YesM